MNANSQRAKEACEACRRSHKKCEFDGNAGCRRCERIRIPCSLFSPVDATVAHQGASSSTATELATTSWDGTPHNPSPQNLSYQTPSQENFFWDVVFFTEAIGEQYPADMMIQTPLANEGQSEQPAMTEDTLYDQNNVFNDHDGLQ